MKIRRSVLAVLAAVMFLAFNVTAFAGSSGDENYTRDYEKTVYTSQQGLEGTATKCILSADNGLIWIGGYAGVFTYDGSSFTSGNLDSHTIAVNALEQDKDGNVWFGTNGEGVYYYDGSSYHHFKLIDDKSFDYVVSSIKCTAKGDLYFGTSNGLYYSSLYGRGMKVRNFEAFDGIAVRYIQELSDGRIVVITKEGEAYLVDSNKVSLIKLGSDFASYSCRCVSEDRDGNIYIGTGEDVIIKYSLKDKKTEKISGNGLNSFNSIYSCDQDCYWICSDIGIGLLSGDHVRKMNFPVNNSVESVCRDYQGNYWFSSSRQGVMQLSKSDFSNLGAYLGMNNATVNSVNFYDGMFYVGSDEGLFCFKGKKEVTSSLTKVCRTKRIREIVVDSHNNLWIATFKNGLYKMTESGKVTHFEEGKKGLANGQIRFLYETSDGYFLIGTEEGLFRMKDGKNVEIKPYIKELSSMRIMDAAESSSGYIFIATDGGGVYEVKGDKVIAKFTKNDGMYSDVVMKVNASANEGVIWVVTGSGICSINSSGKIKKALSIPVANSLDMLIDESGRTFILAGNGLFITTEKDFLTGKNVRYSSFTKRNGLPVDFTANAGNLIHNGKVYMCGVDGIASCDVNEKEATDDIKLYLNSIKADGKNVYDPKQPATVLLSDTRRLNIDMRLLMYKPAEYQITSFLEGYDNKARWIEASDVPNVEYTNLKGGSYEYTIRVYNKDRTQCIKQMTVKIHKNYAFLEDPRVKLLLGLLIIVVCLLILASVIYYIRNRMRRTYVRRYKQKKNEELAKFAYKDLVTGAFNRNLLEEDKQKFEIDELKAVVTVSLNYTGYIRNKFGTTKVDTMLLNLANILKEATPERSKVYRISEKTFCFFLWEHVELDVFARDLKEKFRNMDEDSSVPHSISVGAVYHNNSIKSDVDALIERCEEMRILDEKHAEAKFVEGKIKWL